MTVQGVRASTGCQAMTESAWQAQAEVMHAPAPVLGIAAPAPPAEPHGPPQACKDLGQGLQDDLADRIDWSWLQACVDLHRRLSIRPALERDS